MLDLFRPDQAPTARSTRDSIVVAAWDCFSRFGTRKTTVADISRVAGVSRGTVYQYFPDKRAVLAATAEMASSHFYRALADAMAPGATLSQQLGLAGAFICRSKAHLKSWEEIYDADTVAVLLSSGTSLLSGCIDFLRPYLEAAVRRGEVRPNLDLAAAAEWASRILFSLYSNRSPTIDLDDPNVARRFVEDHAVAGFTAG